MNREGMATLLQIEPGFVFTEEVFGEDLVAHDRRHANKAVLYVEIDGEGVAIEARCGHPGFDCLAHAAIDTADLSATKVIRKTGVYEVALSGQCSCRPVLTGYDSGSVTVAGVLFTDL